MTTSQATTDTGTTRPADQVTDDVLDNTGTESLLTGQEGEETGTDSEVESAMLAGWTRARTSRSNPDVTDVEAKTGKEHGQGDDIDDGAASQGIQQPASTTEDDPDVPGMGMKASELKAQLARLDALEKSTSSTAGHLGHLKQMVQQAGKGKAITKESLSKVREEFGDDYAEALAADLTAAGIGGGASIDDETLGRIVSERVTAEREALEQTFERKLVRQRHPDAADYFKDGKHNGEFIAFVGTLPKERQDELANTWDSEIINAALDEFKTGKAKVEDEKTKQTRRIERSVAPTAARGATVTPAAQDPLEAGWNNVRGRAKGVRAGARA